MQKVFFIFICVFLLPSLASATVDCSKMPKESVLGEINQASYIIKAEVLELYTDNDGTLPVAENVVLQNSDHPAMAKVKILQIYQNKTDQKFADGQISYIEYPDQFWTHGYELKVGEIKDLVIFERNHEEDGKVFKSIVAEDGCANEFWTQTNQGKN